MIIKKNTLIKVDHVRKGKFMAVATEDFDPDKEEFYPLALAEGNEVNGINTVWEAGEEIPVRNSLCKIEVAVKEMENEKI